MSDTRTPEAMARRRERAAKTQPKTEATARPSAFEIERRTSPIFAGCDVVQRTGQNDLADAMEREHTALCNVAEISKREACVRLTSAEMDDALAALAAVRGQKVEDSK